LPAPGSHRPSGPRNAGYRTLTAFTGHGRAYGGGEMDGSEDDGTGGSGPGDRSSYADLVGDACYLAVEHRWDDIADLAGHAARTLPGTLTTLACLAEIRPLIPASERAWIIVADLEAQALLSAGDLAAATRRLRAIHQQAEAHAAADPASTTWQRH